jgi:F-box/leucine-rich repeat protein 10/11
VFEDGTDLTLDWAQSTGLRQPVLIKNKSNLGMLVPAKTFGVKDVAALVGPDTPVTVLEVSTQNELAGWTLQTWADYFVEKTSRTKVRVAHPFSFNNNFNNYDEKRS